ncbi:MAG TPA: hypothetical protein VMU50_07160 [Polyangia bacterium]|nr:hypothetical protein [Polyangia bacterium]
MKERTNRTSTLMGIACVTALVLAACEAGGDVSGTGGSGTDGGSPAGTGGSGGRKVSGGGSGGMHVTGGGSGGMQVTGGGSGGASQTGGGSGGAATTMPVPSESSGCPLFTPDDLWNKDISGAPVDAAWTTKLQGLVGATKIHPDFGTDFGIPINVVPQSQLPIPVTFDDYPDESDPGPYPLPDLKSVILEGTSDPTSCDGDCHLLAVQKGTCELFEGYACHYAGIWHCGNGARWDLTRNSYGQRKTGWTSADAAGLPIYAGLARYEEVKAGAINHAIRFTVKCSSASYVMPATHDAVPGGCGGITDAPPMGLRVRLKAGFDDSQIHGQAKIFVQAFKKYGMILADNGSNFYFQSEQNPSWGDEINDLKTIPASAFEVVTSP